MRTDEMATSEAEYQEEGSALSEVLRILWAQRLMVLVSLILALGFALLYLGVSKLIGYQNQSEYIIQFRFEGRNEGQYPNNTPFSLADIIAPAILGEVYQADQVAQYGLSFADFQSSVTVTPYTPDRALIIDRYSQLDTRKATLAEINEAQAALQRELASASARYAAIRFNDQGAAVPNSKVSEILIHIAQTWERVAIDTRGVLQVDIRTVQPQVFADSSITGLEQLNALKVVGDNITSLKNFVRVVSERQGGNRVRDAQTGNNVSSLQNLIDTASVRLAELPTNWPATSSTTGNATLGLPTNLYSANLFSASDVENLDYLIALDLLQQRVALVRENTGRILERPFGPGTEDPQTGFTAGDVQRLLTDLEDFTIRQVTAPVLSLGIAKSRDVVRLYYNSRLDELQRRKQTLGSKAKVLEDANQNYQGLSTSSGTATAQQAPAPGTGFPASSSTVIPQFGDAFIDRIISLTQQGNDSQFRQKLLDDTINLQQQGADIDSEIARTRDYLSRFTQATQSATPEDVQLRAKFVALLDRDIPATLAKLKDYAEVTQRIAYRLRHAEDIQSITAPVAGATVVTNVDYYLRDASAGGGLSMTDLLKELRGYAEVANRLYQQVSTDALGNYQRLFVATADPRIVRVPLVTRFDVIVLGVAGLLGFVVGTLIALIRGLPRMNRVTGRFPGGVRAA